MVITVTYIIHILSFIIIWYLLHKSPHHFYIRKGFVYIALAFIFLFFDKVYDDVQGYFFIKKNEFPALIISPISTLYHLYFFLLLTSGTFLHKWYGKSYVKKSFIYILMILVVIDSLLQTLIFSYVYTNVFIIIFSIVYFKISLQRFSEKIILRPEDWIIIGYFFVSVITIPLAMIVGYLTKGNGNASLMRNFYPALSKIILLAPQILFSTLFTYGCYNYWLETKKVFVPKNGN
ncbi:MAG: hypothetical protein WAT19_01610 [Ferruginibacter sp.]